MIRAGISLKIVDFLHPKNKVHKICVGVGGAIKYASGTIKYAWGTKIKKKYVGKRFDCVVMLSPNFLHKDHYLRLSLWIIAFNSVFGMWRICMFLHWCFTTTSENDRTCRNLRM